MVPSDTAQPWVLLDGADRSCVSPGCLRVQGLLAVGAEMVEHAGPCYQLPSPVCLQHMWQQL